MCELFAMNASEAVDVKRYLTTLKPRGGELAPHADGWGVAYYEGRAARIFKDPAPAAESSFLTLLARQKLQSSAVIAHIRKANPSKFGRRTANTHPFERELNGRAWVFAHNGKLPGLTDFGMRPDSYFKPLGDTDSEFAFCMIMDSLARATRFDDQHSTQKLARIIRAEAAALSEFGEFNFLLSDGESLFAHAHTRLHKLQISSTSSTHTLDKIVIATEPLSAEPWQAFESSSFHVFQSGREVIPVETEKYFPPFPRYAPDLTAVAV
jgi:predicted glutamine amidotransferase